ncbi:hypothetical protein ACJIZ3_011580 [Penstemon smallii]|uniref:DEUBAD domain-containing protein n=1 Tax=Penstemon smallii TaxID=265156 RepID=A0ABD3UMD3_9LAMI
MAIEKNCFKVARFNPEYHLPHSRDTVMSSDDDDFQRRNSISAVESDDDEDDDEFDDCDSGAGSDDFDLLELGETGEEFCQVGGQTCSIPYELYDLPGLKDVLSMEVWNEVLTEEDRFGLAKYLPDMDQENFVCTLKEIYSGDSLHFGNPVDQLFGMLKIGLCEPRVALYRQGLNFLQRRKHYHNLRKYHNTMVTNVCQLRDAWLNCKGYSIEEKLRVLNIMKSQKSLMNENMEDFESESSDREESGDGLWGKKVKVQNLGQKYSGYGIGAASDISSRGWKAKTESAKHGKQNSIGNSKFAGSKNTQMEVVVDRFPSTHPRVGMKSGRNNLGVPLSRYNNPAGHDSVVAIRMNEHMKEDDGDEEETMYEVAVRRDQNYLRVGAQEKPGASKFGKKHEGSRGEEDLKYDLDSNKTKLSTKVKKHSYRILDGSSHSSRKIKGYSENLEMMRADQMGKMHDVGYSNNFPTIDLDKTYIPGPGHVIGNAGHKKINMLGRNGYVEGNHGGSFHMASLKSRHALEGSQRGEVRHDFDSPQSHYAHDYSCEDELFCTQSPRADNAVPFKLGENVKIVEHSTCHYPERSDVPLIGCNALSKKRKIKDDPTYMDMRDNNDHLHVEAQLRLDDMSTLRKRGKNKVEDAPDSPLNEISGPTFMEHEKEDVKEESKPQKKSFPLIIPTVHTGFSFSIIHLLSAVRVAMITLLLDDSSEAGKPPDMKDSGQGAKEENLENQQRDTNVVNSNSTMDIHTSMPSAQANVPSLTVQDIVNRVKSNPGDPCILETQEPLQDLVRGVLKIFSSRTAPLGAKGWKPLVVYEKSTKGWSWIGPVSHNDCEEAVEEVTSPDAWGLPHKMLVKLVDSFANWLKNSQDTLQQIGSLPAPPLTLMQINLDEKERFKDLKAQKSLSTISQSSEEVRTYFRKEEVLRYLIPDRAFSYTAVDGKKSIVAPLRRCGGKPTSKARDHFMLKRDRPPHVTILCLVRDAAARLPGSIGTRADVCTLIRDSQYIVEDVSDAQVNQVVSGALDRLHYERDPCVQFDGERKLWVYLHREREEEDFEDDGTSSTKKWRRPKKEATEPSDNGDVTVAYPGHVEQPALDLVSDLNVEASCVDYDKGLEPDYHNSNDNVEHNAETSHGSDPSMHHVPTPVMWNGLELNSINENKLAHKTNSVNEDFDEDAFDGEPPA